MSDIWGWRKHYEEAERLLRKSKEDGMNVPLRELLARQAQVHATLATMHVSVPPTPYKPV